MSDSEFNAMREMRRQRLRRAPKFVALALIGVALLTLIVMSLWNWLMPALFALPRVTFWQALGLFVLSKLLFGGFRGRGERAHEQWRGRWRQRWEQMTPEERERVRCGLGRGVQSSDQSRAGA